jgi:hypothetical protein
MERRKDSSPASTERRETFRRRVGWVGVLVGLGFAWWEGYHPWPSLAAHISIVSAIIAVVVLAVLVGRGCQSLSSRSWLHRVGAGLRNPTKRSPLFFAGSVVWIVLALAIAGWDFHSFLREVPSLPTLSYLIGRVSRFVVGRSILVATWLALGVFFAVGHRSKRDVANRSDDCGPRRPGPPVGGGRLS